MSNKHTFGQFDSALLDSLLEQVVVIDRRGLIRWVNNAWLEAAKLRGANPDSVSPGASYLGVLETAARTDSDVARVLDGIKAVLNGSVERFESEYECSGEGEVRFFVERVKPFKHPDGGAVIAHLEITRQKLAELERDSQRMQLARAGSAAALGQLSGAIAHELSQPLAAIVANAQFAVAALRDAAPIADIAAALQEIESSAARSTSIISRISDLLAHRQPTTGVVDVNDVIESTLNLSTRELEACDIHVAQSLAAELPLVRGDSVALQQVILNLVMNSYEAMKSTKDRERRLEISTSSKDPEHVTVEVADTGPGLTKKAAERLYEPLFTTKTNGTGLGLSISKSIIEAHGGTLSVASPASGGVVARIELPIADNAREH